MPEIKYVTVQLAPNRVVEGYYTVTEVDRLTMVYANGEPVKLYEGTTLERDVTHKLKDGENPRAVAHRLTKEIRRIMLDETVDGFSEPINYGPVYVA